MKLIYKTNKKSEMAIFTKTKELITVTYDITENWPKKYRYDFTSSIRNSSIKAYELVVEANEIFIDSKFISDLKRSIEGIKSNISKSNPKIDISYSGIENKLLKLKIIKASKLDERISKRRDKQNQAFAEIKKIEFFYSEAYARKLINAKKWERLSGIILDSINLLKAWISSDRKRFEY